MVCHRWIRALVIGIMFFLPLIVYTNWKNCVGEPNTLAKIGSINFGYHSVDYLCRQSIDFVMLKKMQFTKSNLKTKRNQTDERREEKFFSFFLDVKCLVFILWQKWFLFSICVCALHISWWKLSRIHIVYIKKYIHWCARKKKYDDREMCDCDCNHNGCLLYLLLNATVLKKKNKI